MRSNDIPSGTFMITAKVFRCLAAAAVLLLLAGGVTAARAAEPLALNGRCTVLSLGPHADLLAGAKDIVSISEVSSPAFSGRFVPLSGGEILITRQSPSAWLRFRLTESAGRNDKQCAAGWILEVRPSFSIILDSVDLYLPSGGRTGSPAFTRISTGAMSEARPGDIPSRFFLFELPRGAVSGEYCYLHLASSMEVSVHLNVWPDLALRRRDIVNFFSFGIIFGILLSMVFYNLFVYISLKDRTYLYYILYIGSALVWLFHVQGHSKMFLGQHPAWDLAVVWISVSFTLLWGAVFTISFLAVKKNMPRMYYLLSAMAVLSVLSICAALLHMHRTAFIMTHLGGVAQPVMIIITAAVRLRQRFIPSRFFLLAWFVLAAGGLVFALMGLKVLPVNFWTVNGVAVGVTMESLLLSLALADRIRMLRKEKEYYEMTQKRYLELSVTDGLTGLYNKRYLQSRLLSEVEHALRMELPLSLVLLDIDDFKSVNDLHGHSFGDTVLARLAGTINNLTRECDIACRFGGEEFVLIMPGTRKADAYTTAERIRTRFEAEPAATADGQNIAVTISAGIAELRPGESAGSLLDRADSAMYEAKKQGKNRAAGA